MAGKQKNNLIGKLKILAEITRPLNVLMVGVAVIIAILVGLGTFAPLGIIIPAVLAACCIAAAGNALNDYYDHYIDIINKPDRPLPAGKISPTGVWIYAISLFIIGIFFSLFLTLICIAIALANSILLGMYASQLKKSGFFGNILISYLVASVFAFGGAAVGTLLLGIFLAIVAFFTNAAREVIKDIEDIKGDKLYGAKTLPMIEGKKKSLIVVSAFLIITILVSPIPYFLEILSFYYLILALIADGLFASVIYSILTKKFTLKKIKYISQKLKIGAIIGLIAFLAGTI